MRDAVLMLSLVLLSLAGGLVLRLGWGTRQSGEATAPTPSIADAPKPRFDFVQAFGSLGTDADQFQGPFGIALGPGEDLAVADDLAHRISLFRPDGVLIETLGSKGSAPGELAWVDGVSYSEDGRLWVADTGNHRIQVWRDRRFERVLDLGTIRLENPRGLAAIDSYLLVADYGKRCVRILHQSGGQLRTLGSHGAAARLHGPVGVTVGPDGLIYVSDLAQHAILVYHWDGSFVRRFGKLGSGAGELEEPHGLEFGPEGYLYVADHGNHRIAVWTPDGQFVDAFSGEAAEGGALKSPTDLCFAGDELFVVDKGNHRICRYRVTLPGNGRGD